MSSEQKGRKLTRREFIGQAAAFGLGVRGLHALSAGGDAESDACVTGGGESVATQEFGKKGAKMEIVALLPITHGCHVNTEAELKKAYKKHPDDIHLTIVDFFGPDAPKYQEKVGAGRALVSINGKTSFKLKGKTLILERQENMSYRPADIVPIIEQELRAK